MPRQTSRPISPPARMPNYRQRMRAAGLRPVQIRIPDSRSPDFAEKCRRQARAVAKQPSCGRRHHGFHRPCLPMAGVVDGAANSWSLRQPEILASRVPRPPCYKTPMRPSLLDPLFAPAGSLPGIGPKNAKLFDRLLGKPEGARVVDVLFHLPYATLDRRARPKIRDAGPGHDRHDRGEGHRASRAAERCARARPSRCWSRTRPATSSSCSSSPIHAWVRSRLPIGATRWISGKLELWDGTGRSSIPTGC